MHLNAFSPASGRRHRWAPWLLLLLL